MSEFLESANRSEAEVSESEREKGEKRRGRGWCGS